MSTEFNLTPFGYPETHLEFSSNWSIREQEVLEAVKIRADVINSRFGKQVNIYLSPPLQSIDRIGHQLVVSIPYVDEFTPLEEDVWHDVMRVDLAEFDFFDKGKIPVKLCQFLLPDGSKYQSLDGVRFNVDPKGVISYLDYVAFTGQALPVLLESPLNEKFKTVRATFT